jgi:hypothetical protein
MTNTTKENQKPLWKRLARAFFREALYSLPLTLLVYWLLSLVVHWPIAITWFLALMISSGILAVARETIASKQHKHNSA